MRRTATSSVTVNTIIYTVYKDEFMLCCIIVYYVYKLLYSLTWLVFSRNMYL